MKKILLIHGWNYRNYTRMTHELDAWHNRSEMVSLLEKYFMVYKLNLPGFCGEKEPDHAWNLEDYATYIYEYLEKNHLKVDYILGYSFGGAVAISYYVKYGKREKIILVSPAIIRNHDQSKSFFETPKFLQPIREAIRDFYLIHIVKNNEMVYGTKFLRKTYQIIVREDLREYLYQIPPQDLLIIYGDQDKMVNPQGVVEFLNPEYKKRIEFISGGGHNIGATHPEEVVRLIRKKI